MAHAPEHGGPFRGSLAGVDDDAFPPWMNTVSVVVAVALAVASTLGVPPDGRLPVGLLSAAAAAPMVVRPFVTVELPALSAVSIVALAVINVPGAERGWLDQDASSQMSLLLGVWLVLCDAVACRMAMAAVTAVGMGAVVLGSGLVLGFDATLIWIPGIVLAFVGGRILHSLAWTIMRVRDAEAQVARQSVALQQRRIAREVHDVVAHSLSVTALQLSAARMAADRGDLPATREALADAERLTRTSLVDLRRTVRLLRSGAPEAPPGGDAGDVAVEAALPGLDDLDELVGSFRAAGLHVELDVGPGAATVDPLVQLTAYRTVQEALTNATRHQIGPSATVRLDVARSGDLRVGVESSGTRRAGAGGGHGLAGMRERVAALGGTVEAGATSDGWRVAVVVPRVSASDDLGAPRPDGAAAAGARAGRRRGPVVGGAPT